MPESEGRQPFEYYPKWRDDAVCATPTNRRIFFEERDIWFHPDKEDPAYDEEQVRKDQTTALSLCFSCPVRDLCLRDALEDQRIDGTRGGLTEDMTRETLSVDEFGKEIRRGTFPECPYCGAHTSSLTLTKIPLPDGGRWSEAKAVKCSDCGFEWKSRSSHNAVLAFQLDRDKMEEQKREEEIARERLS